MSAATVPDLLVRNAASAERRWFCGGGVFTWLATAQDTNGAFLLWEDWMQQGKLTPLHTHPVEETMYVLEGEIVMHLDGTDHRVAVGGLALAPRGVPHAFMVASEFARILTLQTPGTCEAFYRGASDPLADGQQTGVVDFERVAASARENGGIEIVGPPPFAVGG
jgi:quercetin dioxygenase-like cupin family protein